jgi:hypothetical protein
LKSIYQQTEPVNPYRSAVLKLGPGSFVWCKEKNWLEAKKMKVF